MKKKTESKLRGGRFQEGVTDAVERFTDSVFFDKELYKRDIVVSRVHANMLARQGLITVSEGDDILHGPAEIKRSIEAGEFEWQKDREDVQMNIEATLTDIIGEFAKKLHTARSQNPDVEQF
ncbi:argininosuccinate lyase, chloroplastic-like isoform X2 [Typha angustifolia]|uniref:argininosuccinate lyase, chloroplastic-like isoform X2 n=1 Tax=Typha angustifolia TaxID=59011 RepID=UPI003C2BCA00